MKPHIITALALAATCAILTLAPIGVDWEHTFSRVRLSDPYQVETFFNPPFVLLLLPHAHLPLHWGNAINLTLNIAVILFAAQRLGGGWGALALVFTSPVFFDLMRTNNIDWIPLLGLVVGDLGGSILLICKPQSLIGALFVWAKRNKGALLVPLALLAVSCVIWGIPGTAPPFRAPYNFSIFPVGLLVGIPLLLRAWRSDDAYLGAVATPLCTPYIAPYSLTGVLVVLACKFPKVARWAWLALWGFAIIEYRRIAS